MCAGAERGERGGDRERSEALQTARACGSPAAPRRSGCAAAKPPSKRSPDAGRLEPRLPHPQAGNETPRRAPVCFFRTAVGGPLFCDCNKRQPTLGRRIAESPGRWRRFWRSPFLFLCLSPFSPSHVLSAPALTPIIHPHFLLRLSFHFLRLRTLPSSRSSAPSPRARRPRQSAQPLSGGGAVASRLDGAAQQTPALASRLEGAAERALPLRRVWMARVL